MSQETLPPITDSEEKLMDELSGVDAKLREDKLQSAREQKDKLAAEEEEDKSHATDTSSVRADSDNRRREEELKKEIGEEAETVTVDSVSSTKSSSEEQVATTPQSAPETSPTVAILQSEIERKLNALYIDCSALSTGRTKHDSGLLTKVINAISVASGLVPAVGGVAQTVVGLAGKASEEVDKKHSTEKAKGFLAILGNRTADSSRYCDFAYDLSVELANKFASELPSVAHEEATGRWQRAVRIVSKDNVEKKAVRLADQVVALTFASVTNDKMQSVLEDSEFRAIGGVCNKEKRLELVASVVKGVTDQRSKPSVMERLSNFFKSQNGKAAKGSSREDLEREEYSAKLEEDDKLGEDSITIGKKTFASTARSGGFAKVVTAAAAAKAATPGEMMGM